MDEAKQTCGCTATCFGWAPQHQLLFIHASWLCRASFTVDRYSIRPTDYLMRDVYQNFIRQPAKKDQAQTLPAAGAAYTSALLEKRRAALHLQLCLVPRTC